MRLFSGWPRKKGQAHVTDESGEREELRAHGAAAVRRALDLHLTVPGWSSVAALIKELTAAFDDRNFDTMADVILDLDGLRSPRQQEGDAKSAAPPDIRSEGMKVVHRLVPPDQPRTPKKDDEG